MEKYKGFNKTQIIVECLEEGESIEEMLRRAISNNEPIEANAPMIYTEEAKGVQPEFDIRTDRQELALDATDKFSKSQRASSDEKPPVNETNTETTEIEIPQ